MAAKISPSHKPAQSSGLWLAKYILSGVNLITEDKAAKGWGGGTTRTGEENIFPKLKRQHSQQQRCSLAGSCVAQAGPQIAM